MQLATFYFLLLLELQRTVTGQSLEPSNETITALNNQSSATTTVEDVAESCSKAWQAYVESYSSWSNAAKWTRRTVTATQFFETIQWFGPNKTYTECDGIPRLSFSPPPTISQPAMISVVRSTTLKDELIRTSGQRYPHTPRGCGTPGEASELSNYLSVHPQSLTTCDAADASLKTYLGLQTDNVSEASKTVSGSCLYGYFCELDLEKEIIIIHWGSDAKNNQIKDSCSPDTTRVINMPTTTTPAHLKRVKTFKTSALTFRGGELYLKSSVQEENGERKTYHTNIPIVSSSVLHGPFTFTYPTVYMAHREIAVSGFINQVIFGDVEGVTFRSAGRVLTEQYRPAGIVALQSEQVFSVRPVHGFSDLNEKDYAQSVAQGKFRPRREYAEQTLPLNFADLLDPVPASVYFDARRNDCWGEQKHCGTITDDSYRPEIRLDRKIWESLIPGRPCDVPNLVDPPVALTEIDAEGTLVLPNFPQYPGNAALTTVSAQAWLHMDPGPSPGGNIQPAIATATSTPRGNPNGMAGTRVAAAPSPGRTRGSEGAHGEIGNEYVDPRYRPGGGGNGQRGGGNGISQADRNEHEDGWGRDSWTNGEYRGTSAVFRGSSSSVREHILAVLASNLGAIWAARFLFTYW